MIHLLIALALARPDPSALWEAVDAARIDAVPNSLAPSEQAIATQFFAEVVRTAPSGVVPQDFERRASALGFDVEYGAGFVLLRPVGGAADGIYVVRLGEVEQELGPAADQIGWLAGLELGHPAFGPARLDLHQLTRDLAVTFGGLGQGEGGDQG